MRPFGKAYPSVQGRKPGLTNPITGERKLLHFGGRKRHTAMDYRLLKPSIVLTSSTSTTDDANRFVDHFRIVWLRLPPIVRRAFRLHWKTRTGSPSIQLCSFGYNSAGNMRNSGHELWFNDDLLRIMPDCHVETAIAHELGHVFFILLDEDEHKAAQRQPNTRTHVLACEFINLELIRRWGFKQDELSEWLNCSVSQNGPYLCSDAREAPMSVALFREQWQSIVREWSQERGGESEYDNLLACKEQYYKIAQDRSDYYRRIAKADLTALVGLLHREPPK